MERPTRPTRPTRPIRPIRPYTEQISDHDIKSFLETWERERDDISYDENIKYKMMMINHLQLYVHLIHEEEIKLYYPSFYNSILIDI